MWYAIGAGLLVLAWLVVRWIRQPAEAINVEDFCDRLAGYAQPHHVAIIACCPHENFVRARVEAHGVVDGRTVVRMHIEVMQRLESLSGDPDPRNEAILRQALLARRWMLAIGKLLPAAEIRVANLRADGELESYSDDCWASVDEAARRLGFVQAA